MGTTPVYKFRYPAATDPADVPTDMQELALDVEAAIEAIPAGPPGPPGPPGGSSSVLTYLFKTATSVPPGSGELRTNNADQTAATRLYLANQTAGGTDATNILTLLTAGMQVALQDQDDSTKRQRYTLTADAISQQGYAELPVTWTAGNLPLTNQTGNQRTLASLIYQGKQGPPGPGVAAGGTTGQVLAKKTAADYDTQWVSPATAPGYGTSLPVSPVDGQEYILVDSTTNPTYQWRFRYNAASASAYKWEFIGGTPARVIAGGAWTTVGAWTVPIYAALQVARAGEYLATPSLAVLGNAGSTSTIYVGVGVQNVQQLQTAVFGVNANWYATVGGVAALVTAQAGQSIQVSGYQTSATQANTTATISVLPKRVS
jgi:hypothetical protein